MTNDIIINIPTDDQTCSIEKEEKKADSPNKEPRLKKKKAAAFDSFHTQENHQPMNIAQMLLAPSQMPKKDALDPNSTSMNWFQPPGSPSGSSGSINQEKPEIKKLPLLKKLNEEKRSSLVELGSLGEQLDKFSFGISPVEDELDKKLNWIKDTNSELKKLKNDVFKSAFEILFTEYQYIQQLKSIQDTFLFGYSNMNKIAETKSFKELKEAFVIFGEDKNEEVEEDVEQTYIERPRFNSNTRYMFSWMIKNQKDRMLALIESKPKDRKITEEMERCSLEMYDYLRGIIDLNTSFYKKLREILLAYYETYISKSAKISDHTPRTPRDVESIMFPPYEIKSKIEESRKKFEQKNLKTKKYLNNTLHPGFRKKITKQKSPKSDDSQTRKSVQKISNPNQKMFGSYSLEVNISDLLYDYSSKFKVGYVDFVSVFKRTTELIRYSIKTEISTNLLNRMTEEFVLAELKISVSNFTANVVSPIQRIARYQLLFGNIIKKTHSQQEELEHFFSCLSNEEKNEKIEYKGNDFHETRGILKKVSTNLSQTMEKLIDGGFYLEKKLSEDMHRKILQGLALQWKDKSILEHSLVIKEKIFFYKCTIKKNNKNNSLKASETKLYEHLEFIGKHAKSIEFRECVLYLFEDMYIIEYDSSTKNPMKLNKKKRLKMRLERIKIVEKEQTGDIERRLSSSQCKTNILSYHEKTNKGEDKFISNLKELELNKFQYQISQRTSHSLTSSLYNIPAEFPKRRKSLNIFANKEKGEEKIPSLLLFVATDKDVIQEEEYLRNLKPIYGFTCDRQNIWNKLIPLLHNTVKTHIEKLYHKQE